MGTLVRWRGRGATRGSLGGPYLYEGDRGIGDTAHPSVVETLEHLQSRAWIGQVSGARKTHSPAIELSHYALAVVPGANQCYVSFQFPSQSNGLSFRLYMRTAGSASFGGDFQVGTRPVLYGYGAGDTTLRWQLDMLKDDLVVVNIFNPAQNYWSGRKQRLSAPGVTPSTFSTYQIGGPRTGAQNPTVDVTVRIEGRLSPTGLLQVHIFEDAVSATVPRSTHQLQLLQWQMDALVIGVRPASTVLCPILQFDDIEVWDEYPTGTGSTWCRGPYTLTPSSFHEVTAPGVTSPLTLAGVVTSPGVVTPVAEWEFNDEVVFDVVDSDPDITYFGTTGVPGFRQLDLYRPSADTGFVGPHPVIVWAHSGFFTQGSRKAIPPRWVADLCSAGFAVASIQYPLVYSVEFFGDPAHPDQIVAYKYAVRWLQQNAGDLNLDASKVFASGYSAGGYLGLACAITKDRVSGPGGFNLTLAGKGYGGPDPTVLGAYCYAAPVNWTRMVAEDSTGSIIKSTAETYMGRRPAGEADANLHTMIQSGCAPIGYCLGTADPLIGMGNMDDLEAACLAAGVPFLGVPIVSHHDNIDTVNRPLLEGGIVPWALSIMGGSPP